MVALLLLAPAIPELLTGSTPVTTVFYDPFGFLLSFGFDVALYGTGALLIREFAVAFNKGWASILLLGAAYGIGEEGFAVHTFFESHGSPADALGVYGHAFGVNWLWALGLTAFHATYSIALPILLTQLWFPAVKRARWLDASAVGVVAVVYVLTVLTFDLTVGHGPTPAAFAFFAGVVVVLIALAVWAPSDLLRVGAGRARIRPVTIALVGSLLFDAWLAVLILSDTPVVPAAVVAAGFVAVGLASIWIILRRIGADDLEWSKFYFATGMLAILFVWDGIVEFSVPGILLVSAVFIYLLYRLRNTMRAREAIAPPVGAALGPA